MIAAMARPGHVGAPDRPAPTGHPVAPGRPG